MDLQFQTNSSEWLNEVLEETGLQQFHSKLTNDLQLTKLSHFDFVSEEDLLQLGMSRPAAKRLLASIKKRKSFVIALKNKIVNKLTPNSSATSSSTNPSAKGYKQQNELSHMTNHNINPGVTPNDKGGAGGSSNESFGRLTCLINSQDVQIKEEIGHGVHGFVNKGEWTAPNGRVVEVALKILRKDVMAEPGASFNDFVKEISVMHQLNHPNIIKLYGVVLSSPMMMVTELAPLGNLRDRLKKENGNTPISQLINFGVQITSGMEYLESKRFVHRDLAARNIFISHGKKILIGDLGLMRAIPNQEDHYVMSEKTKIPYPWCAPESLKYKQFSSVSDVYMFGVTLWEMFSFGKEPWAGLVLNEILENISSQKKRLPCPEACPTMVYQTLLQCWNTDPSCRPNFSTLYQYLSTSYPLEVRSSQHISELGQKRQNGLLIPDDLTDSPFTQHVTPNKTDNFVNEASGSKQQYPHRKVLNCNVDDRILVIDGQPEKYWWKGQNQRTFEIGWFPLCSTRWLAPKKGTGYISKPLKNSFVHTAHCGPNGRWGSPKDIGNAALRAHFENRKLDQTLTNFPKQKAKSRLSRLFGINDTSNSSSPTAHLLPHSYQRFNNASHGSCNKMKPNGSDDLTGQLERSQSDEFSPREKLDNEPPLIDFSDEIDTTVISNSPSLLSSAFATATLHQQESLIDMDNDFPTNEANLQRHSSDTRLDRKDCDYHLSWAGSWNTGTFDGSSGNIYSAYYCPQDAASAVPAPLVYANTQEPDANRYYSSVAHEEDRVATK